MAVVSSPHRPALERRRSGSTAEIALFALLTVACALLYLERAGAALDDMYVYFRVARNWADGFGPVFNPHDALFVTTSPIWLALLTVGTIVLPSVSILTLAQVMFIAGLIAASVFLRLILRPRFAVAATLSPVAVFLSPSMPSLCGHDTGLALGIGLGLIWCVQSRRLNSAAIVAALFYLTRGEGAVFGLVALGYLFVLPDRSLSGARARLRAALPGLLIGIALIVAWHLYYAGMFDGVFPSTLHAKMVQGHSKSFSRVHPYFYRHYLAAFSVVAVPIVVYGLYVCLRGVPLLFWWPVAHLGAFYVTGVSYYHWYYYPVELVLMVAGALAIDRGVAVVRQRLGRDPGRAGLPSLAVALIAFVVLANPVRGAVATSGVDVYRKLVAGVAVWPHVSDARQQGYRDVVDWLRRSATVTGRPRSLSVEVGMLGYWLPEFDVYDVVGLIYPARTGADLYDWPRIVGDLKPDLLLYTGKTTSETLEFGPLRYRRVFVPPQGLANTAVYCRADSTTLTCLGGG